MWGGEGVLAHACHQCMVDDADADLHLLGFTTKLCESRPGEGLAQSRMGAGGGVEWGGGQKMAQDTPWGESWSGC